MYVKEKLLSKERVCLYVCVDVFCKYMNVCMKSVRVVVNNINTGCIVGGVIKMGLASLKSKERKGIREKEEEGEGEEGGEGENGLELGKKLLRKLLY